MPKFFDTDKIFEQANDDLILLGIHNSRDQLRYDYEDLCIHLYKLSKIDSEKFYKTVRQISEEDFFFFAYYVLDLPLDHPYLIARCYELQDLKDEKYLLLLAARDHYKSVLTTIAFPIWEVLLDPNLTTAVFSFERGKAKAQLMSIKQICETNELLKTCWNHIFYSKKGQSETRWNLDNGLYVKRKSTVKEATFSAWGLIEGCISHHFDRIITDDAVTDSNSYSTDQINKVKDSYRMHAGLGTRRVQLKTISTCFDADDLSSMLLKDDRYKKVIIPGEVNSDGKGCYNSIPVYKTRKELDDIYLDFGANFYSGQILQDPTMVSDKRLQVEWITHYEELPKSKLNKIIICDPANAKNKRSDSTVMAVIGVDFYKQAFLVDMFRDKVDVYERYALLKELYQRHDPNDVYYESQGLMSDITVFEREMQRDNFFFPIQPISSNEQNLKIKIINALGAELRKKKFLLPKELYYTDITGVERELINEFIEEEYKKFPNNRSHDDMLNAMAWFTRIDIVYPDEEEPVKTEEKKMIQRSELAEPFLRYKNNETTWQSSFVW